MQNLPRKYNRRAETLQDCKKNERRLELGQRLIYNSFVLVALRQGRFSSRPPRKGARLWVVLFG